MKLLKNNLNIPTPIENLELSVLQRDETHTGENISNNNFVLKISRKYIVHEGDLPEIELFKLRVVDDTPPG